jgi:hypothetical protein
LAGALVGNLTGRFAATLIDFGFDNEQIEAVAKRLGTGQPALVIEFDDTVDMASVRTDIAPFGAEIVDPGSNRTVEDILPQPNEDVKIDDDMPAMNDIPSASYEEERRGKDAMVDIPVIPVGAGMGINGVAPILPVAPVVVPNPDATDEERERARNEGVPPMNPAIP